MMDGWHVSTRYESLHMTKIQLSLVHVVNVAKIQPSLTRLAKSQPSLT